MSFNIEFKGTVYTVSQDSDKKKFFDITFNDSYQRIVEDYSGNWHYAEMRDLEKKTDPLPLQSLGLEIRRYLKS